MSAPASNPYAVDPFGPSANPAAYVPCEAGERARATLERSLREGRVAALLGPPGLGKTVILHLVRAREAEHAEVAYVPFCTLEADELFALVLNLLGERPGAGPPREALLERARRRADRGGILLLVDDAAALPTATAEALAEVVHDGGGAVRLGLAAVEGPDARRVCGAFGTRVDVVRLSEGMTEREARRYVEIRLAYAGARPDLVAAFDEDTVSELHRESRGVPRRLNQMAHELVRQVSPGSLPRLAEVLGRSSGAAPQPPPEPAPPPTPPRVAPPSEPAPPALRERDAFRETGAYRVVRGRSVDPTGAPARAGGAPAPETSEPPEEAAGFAHLASTPATPEGVAAAPEAPRPPAPRRSLLFAGAAVFAFSAALAFAWASGRLPAALPGTSAERAGARAQVAAPAAPGPEAAEAPSAPPVAPPARAVEEPPPVPAAPVRETARAEAPAPQPAPPAPAVAEERAAPEPAPAPEPRVAEAPSPRPDAPAPEPVSVAINALPWAVVEVDGRELGETPLAGIRLAPGPHTFRARMPDGTLRERTVEISPERRTVVFGAEPAVGPGPAEGP